MYACNRTDQSDPQECRAKKLEIKLRYARKRPKPGVGLRMLRELRKVLADKYDRFGPAMPEGDDGALDDFLVLINYTAMLGDYRALRAAKERWQPSLSEAAFEAMVAEVTANPLYLSPDQLGARVGLYDATRTRLKVRSIGAVDCTKQQRVERRKKNKIKARKVQRAAARALRPAPASETQPWLAFGRSRSWWHANGKPTPQEIGQNLTPSKLSFLLLGVNNCPTGAPSPTSKGRHLGARGVAVSAGEKVFDAERGVPRESLSLAARARENPKTEAPLMASSINVHGVAKSRNAAPQQIREVFSMPKMQDDPSPRDLAADHAEAARNPTVLRKLTQDETESFIRRRETFDRLRQSYPNQPAADAAVVDILFNRMLLDRHSFVPLLKTISDSARAVRAGRVKREDLPTLKRVLVVNWNQAHHVAVTKLRVAA